MIKQRGNLLTKLLILGYIAVFLILVTLTFSNVIVFNFQQPHRPVPPVVDIFQKSHILMVALRLTTHKKVYVEFWRDSSLTSMQHTSFLEQSTQQMGMSIFIIPTSADNAFFHSLYVHSPSYYTYYSGQTKYVQLNITLPAGSYYLYMLNLGTTDSNFTLAESIVATLLSNS